MLFEATPIFFKTVTVPVYLGAFAGGGGYSIYPWVGRCGAAPHTLTLFKTNIAGFPTLFKTEFRFFDTLFKTFILFKTIIDKSIS